MLIYLQGRRTNEETALANAQSFSEERRAKFRSKFTRTTARLQSTDVKTLRIEAAKAENELAGCRDKPNELRATCVHQRMGAY